MDPLEGDSIAVASEGCTNLATRDLHPEVVSGTVAQTPPLHAPGGILTSGKSHSSAIGNNSCIDNCDNSCIDCEHVISRDLVQLPAAGLAHRHMCEASHTANVENNLHMYRQLPNLHISNEFYIACPNQTAGSNMQMFCESDEDESVEDESVWIT